MPARNSDAAESVAFMLSTLGYAVSRRFIRALEPLELHPREFAVLRAVSSSHGASQQSLAGRLHIPPSRMVGIVDELESRGLIERRPDPDDRRIRALHVTKRGQGLLDDAFDLVVTHERAISDALTATERKDLLALLARIARQLGLSTSVHPALGEADKPADS